MEDMGVGRVESSLAWVLGWKGSRVSSKDKLDVSSARSSGAPDRSRAGAASVMLRCGPPEVMSRLGTPAVMFRVGTAPVTFNEGAAPVIFRDGAAPVMLKLGAAPVRLKLGAPVMLSPVLECAPEVSMPWTAVELHPVLSLVPGSTKLAWREVSCSSLYFLVGPARFC